MVRLLAKPSGAQVLPTGQHLPNMDVQPHMVEQVIKYSDGSETVIKYRGVIVDGVLTADKVEETSDLPQRPSVVEDQPEYVEKD